MLWTVLKWGFRVFNVCEIWVAICYDFDDKAQNLYVFFCYEWGFLFKIDEIDFAVVVEGR